MSSELGRRVARRALFIVAVCATALAIFYSWSRPVDETAREHPLDEPWVLPARNEWLDSPNQNGDERRPLVLAWELNRMRSPTFALYADGLWLLHSLQDEESTYRTSQMSIEDSRALHARFLDAGLETVPPWQTRTPGQFDQASTTFCVAREERWICATLQGMDSRRDPEPRVLILPSGRQAEVGREGVSGGLPTPEPFRTAASALASMDSAGGREWSPLEMHIAVWLVDRADVGRRPAVRWPSELPRLPIPSAADRPAALRVSPDEAAQIRRFQRSVADIDGPTRFPVGDREVIVDVATPRLPAHDDILELSMAFYRLTHPH